MMAGAVLTQNTAWTNVERAIANLRRARRLTPARMHALPLPDLAALIRPAGYFNVKARRLRALTGLICGRYGGRLDRLFALDTGALRSTLLDTHGIGPETADSIVLYAAGRPVFVIDAYTRRMMARHGWAPRNLPYDALAARFTASLPRDTTLYNEYHALIVALGKHYCRPSPRCTGCPLRDLLPSGGPRGGGR
jgi:endonuclease-3 related protein